jgi:ribosomal protein L37E
MSSKPTSGNVARPFVKLAIGVFGLLIIRYILSRLPMIKDAPPIPDVGLSYSTLGGAVVDTIIFVLIFRFGLEVEKMIEGKTRRIPDAGRMVRLGVIIIIAALAYNAYSDVAFAFLRREMWIYSVGCLILVGIPVLALASLIYKNIDSLTDLVMGGLKRASKPHLTCLECGAPYNQGAKFCSGCGAGIPVAEATMVDALALQCGQCGASLNPGAKFCAGCGTASQAVS